MRDAKPAIPSPAIIMDEPPSWARTRHGTPALHSILDRDGGRVVSVRV
jgi:hypothetical protein